MNKHHLQRAQRSIEKGRADLAIKSLRKLTKQEPLNLAAWKLLGFAYHEEQLESEAVDAFTKAEAIDSEDVLTVMSLAQSTFLSGLSAVEHFDRALRLAPGNLDALRGYALALASENHCDVAETVLCRALKVHPDWLDGHKVLTRLRYTRASHRHFADSYRDACAKQPQNLALRLEWFRAVAQTRDWITAGRIVGEAERVFNSQPQLLLARLFIASESGDILQSTKLFADTTNLDDEMRDMALVRHHLRQGNLDSAESTARLRIGTPSEAVFWPYLSLIWRLKGIPQAAEWLDGSPPFVSAIDLDFEAGDLDRLADLLRRLHTARNPFTEQSVRGGTQTDQNLFLRHEPILRQLKSQIQSAVSQYVGQLPAPVQGHPLLGVKRDEPLRGRTFFSGSWSVRLLAQGFNVSHNHPMGWISSALYVSLPKLEQMGKPPAGWIRFGTPPAELKLSLPPCLQKEPKAGRLVLFPSTMWHSTVPFDDGERLVVAFDIRRPRATVQSNKTINGGQSHEAE